MNLKTFFLGTVKTKFSFLHITSFSLPILLRNFLFQFIKKEKSSKIKTICIGNIYIGVLKTPLTIKIYEILKNLNNRVATVKKDYLIS